MSKTTLHGEDVLAIPMGRNDAGASNIKGYLKAIVRQVWEEGEGFSGKRPFGNSGWEHELYIALVRAGAVPGYIDEDGYLGDINQTKANQLIEKAIEAL